MKLLKINAFDYIQNNNLLNNGQLACIMILYLHTQNYGLNRKSCFQSITGIVLITKVYAYKTISNSSLIRAKNWSRNVMQMSGFAGCANPGACDGEEE